MLIARRIRVKDPKESGIFVPAPFWNIEADICSQIL